MWSSQAMVTTVGTEAHVVDLLSDLIHLDFDAADAYQAAIDRIKDQQFAATLRAFKDDHLQHVAELSSILSGMGHEPPEELDMKSLLTRGKVIIGSLAGDSAILAAMRSNEIDTNTAYERAVAHGGLDDVMRDVLQRGLSDERRHSEWVISAIETLRGTEEEEPSG
jgi:uncharacterized protein (TIGR02284 family)